MYYAEPNYTDRKLISFFIYRKSGTSIILDCVFSLIDYGGADGAWKEAYLYVSEKNGLKKTYADVPEQTAPLELLPRFREQKNKRRITGVKGIFITENGDYFLTRSGVGGKKTHVYFSTCKLGFEGAWEHVYIHWFNQQYKERPDLKNIPKLPKELRKIARFA